MASNFLIPSVAAAGTAPAIVSTGGARIPIPAANATPLPALSPRSPSAPHRPVTAFDDKDVTTATLVLKDGSSYQGISFGSEEKSISGECVFQTGNFCIIFVRSGRKKNICFLFVSCLARSFFVKHVKLKLKRRHGWLSRIFD